MEGLVFFGKILFGFRGEEKGIMGACGSIARNEAERS